MVKTGTKFIIRDTEQCMGEHRGKQFVYPTQKQGRDAHPERKGIGILSNEGGREVNQALGRDTHPERSASILSD